MLEIFSLETEVLEPSDIHPHLALLVEDFIKDLNSNTNNILPISIFSILFKMFHSVLIVDFLLSNGIIEDAQ